MFSCCSDKTFFFLAAIFFFFQGFFFLLQDMPRERKYCKIREKKKLCRENIFLALEIYFCDL